MPPKLETSDGDGGFVELDKIRQFGDYRSVDGWRRQVLWEGVLVMLFFRLDGRWFCGRRKLEVVMRIRTWSY